jgi:large subunit ribosomal protein L21
MYAIIEDGGKQYKVSEGERIEVELRDAEVGDIISFDRILFLGGESVSVGMPYVENARVTGTVEAETKGKKVISFKFRHREPYHRKVGHRQKYLRVLITEIAGA